MINIGSKENPILVSNEALKPGEEAEREYWEGVASGSIIIEAEALDLLLGDDRLRQGDGKSE